MPFFSILATKPSFLLAAVPSSSSSLRSSGFSLPHSLSMRRRRRRDSAVRSSTAAEDAGASAVEAIKVSVWFLRWVLIFGIFVGYCNFALIYCNKGKRSKLCQNFVGK